jgi:hypothetical protein
MVYDNLLVTTKHHVLAYPLSLLDPSTSSSSTRLVTMSMPVQILRVCREIYHKANYPLRQRLASCQRLQLIIDPLSMPGFLTRDYGVERLTNQGILNRIMNDCDVGKPISGETL